MSSEPAVLRRIAPLVSSAQTANTSRWITTASIVAADTITLCVVLGLIVLGRHLVTPTYRIWSYLDLFPYTAVLIGAFWIQGLYPGLLLHPAEEIRRIFLSISTVFLIMASCTFLWRNAESYSRSVFLISWLAGAPVVLLTRNLTRAALSTKPWWGLPAIVLGGGFVAERVVRGLRTAARGIRVIGILSDDNMYPWPDDMPPILGDIAYAPSLARSGAAQYAIVTSTPRSKAELHEGLLDNCSGFRHVLIIPDMPGFCSLGMGACEVGGEVGLELPQRLFHRSAAICKRTIDVVTSALLIVLLAPFFALTCIAVALSSPGPLLYQHTRKGRSGSSFKALKFRTMAVDADRLLADHLEKHPEASLEWERDHKLKKDPRVTRVGIWLRRFSIDELPQLLNVLAGQMSLVGPRPIVDSEVGRYGKGYTLYSRVRPGITGMWQVSGRNNTTYAERVMLDEYYVRNWSIWLDLYILTRTLRVVLSGRGAY